MFKAIAALLTSIAFSTLTMAQATAPLPDAPTPQAAASDRPVTILSRPRAVLKDEEAFLTSPAHIKPHDLLWLAPFAAATGAAIATDHHVMSSVVSHDPGFNNANVNTSNVLIGGLIATPFALFGAGELNHNPHAREAGILGGETLVDGVIVEQGLKLVFWRERPALDNSRGLFFQSAAGPDSSFPSSHAVLAWSTAALIAGEYPKPWVEAAVYTTASAISVTRVLGQQHFPTDVLVGSVSGWLIGHYVFRKHHRQFIALR